MIGLRPLRVLALVRRNQFIHLQDLMFARLNRLVRLIDQFSVDIFVYCPSPGLRILQALQSVSSLIFAPFVKIQHSSTHPVYLRRVRSRRDDQARPPKFTIVLNRHVTADLHQMRVIHRAHAESGANARTSPAFWKYRAGTT